MADNRTRCIELVARQGGRVDVYDPRLDEFCAGGEEPNVLNQCFRAGTMRQMYNGDTDAGYIELLPAGWAIASLTLGLRRPSPLPNPTEEKSE